MSIIICPFVILEYFLICRKTSSDEDVITFAKNLIKAWKKFLPDNSGTSSAGNEKDKKVKMSLCDYNILR